MIHLEEGEPLITTDDQATESEVAPEEEAPVSDEQIAASLNRSVAEVQHLRMYGRFREAGPFVTQKELAKKLQVPESVIRRARVRGEISALYLGENEWRYDLPKVTEELEALGKAKLAEHALQQAEEGRVKAQADETAAKFEKLIEQALKDGEFIDVQMAADALGVRVDHAIRPFAHAVDNVARRFDLVTSSKIRDEYELESEWLTNQVRRHAAKPTRVLRCGKLFYYYRTDMIRLMDALGLQPADQKSEKDSGS